ncbi:hypothetical protein EDC01DRAFT_628028 [Geopyxis carbonaria]|nr:hypothetical protein EDC01DRAFT_628028 [Geopyxis carbonaria]
MTSTTGGSVGHSRRRKSFAFFHRPSVLHNSDISPWASQDDISPKPRPKSALFGSSSDTHEISTMLSTQSLRSKGLTKTSTSRPRSMFGSLKPYEITSPMVESSASSSLESSYSGTAQPHDSVIVHSGEVVTGAGLLRRKKEYFVLTNRELLRYKSEQKANEAFGFGGINASVRPSSVATMMGDLIIEQHKLVTMMNQVVAVYHPGGDAEVDSSVQVDYFEGGGVSSSGVPSSTVLVAASPTEAQLWIDRLRSVSLQARVESPPLAFPESTVEYIARRLESEKDYSPTHFQVFRVVQRSGKTTNRTNSIEDFQKMYSTICYLAIGIHKIHLVPYQRFTNQSITSISTVGTVSHAILNLTDLSLSHLDECFSLTFRSPCHNAQKWSLASADAPDIIQALRQSAEYLRPMWQIPPFSINIPESMKDEPLPDIPATPGDDLGGFDRTLSAYCTAYELDASNIVYAIQTDVEDSPRFVLYPPAHHRRHQYTDLEVLALLRTLRWNEWICSISFHGVSLQSLDRVYDNNGTEYEPRFLKGGRQINLKAGQGQKSLLVHELRALALYNGKLRRLDFSDCMKLRPESNNDEGAMIPGLAEKACAIVEAIMPLCRRGLTNVDWLVLTGIELVEADLDWLVDAAASRLAHFRGIELARCALTERMLTVFLNALVTHENTLESLDLSGNPGRMHSPSLNNSMCYFPFLRKLNLSRLLRTSGVDAVLAAETLLRWRLEELNLSETKLNAESIDAIATYLASPRSDSLQHLALQQCGLTSKDVAVLMHSMKRSSKTPRSLHLYIGRNPLSQNASCFIECIRQGITPSHLTMQMVDYPKEEMFQELIRAFSVNNTLVYLDISKASLPYEAGEQTCAELGNMFARNTTLRELDISGEQAILESASIRLGSGLVKSLARLAENTTLEVLRIELQALGTPGAMELASLIAKNKTLRQLYCEMNEIHLQGFTAMVNSMQKNTTLTYLPRMDRDRAEHVRCLKEKLFQPICVTSGTQDKKVDKERKSSFRKGVKGKKVSFSEDDALNLVGVEKSLMLLEEKWESEAQRLQGFLARNNMNLRSQKYTFARDIGFS